MPSTRHRSKFLSRRGRSTAHLHRQSVDRRRLGFESLEDRRMLAVLTVDNLNDTGAGSLREAITIANAMPGQDTIDFFVTGTINLQSQLPTITDDLNITGPGANQLTLNAGGGATATSGDGFRVFEINDGAYGSLINVALSGLKITGGDVTGRGGGINNFENLTVIDSTISGNTSSGNGNGGGGGIYNSQYGGTLELTGSTVSGNSAEYGGGIVNNGGTVNVTSSTINGNSAAYGAGGINNSGGTVNVTSSTISGNSATNSGGGISNGGTMGTVNVTSSTISGNSASDGGGIFNFFSGTVNVTSSTISGNSANYDGGGIGSLSGTANITSSTISGNSASDGGGIYIFSGSVTVASSIVAGNTDSFGGNVQGGFSDNGFNLIGGDPLLGPLADNGGPTLTHGLLPGSSALDAGAATIASLGTASQSSEFPAFGGPFPASNALDGDFNNFTHTAANDENPQFTLAFDMDQIITQVVLHNRSGFEQRLRDITVEVLDASGTVVFASGLLNPGNNLNNPTALTVTLPVAVTGRTVRVTRTSDPDGANPSDSNVLSLGEIEVFSTDQRGLPRPALGAVDIGAFEAQETPSLVVATTDDVIDETDQQTSLREAIAFANALPGADTITFDPLVFGAPQTIALNSQLPTITDSLTITGPGADLLTLDAGNGVDDTFGTGDGFRIFDIDNSNSSDILDVAISGLTLTGGDANSNDLDGDGGAIRTAENLTLTSSVIIGNHSGADGGGIAAVSGDVTITDSTVSGNTSSNNGGGIFTSSGDVELNSSTVSGNSATGANTDGGGILAIEGDVTLNSSTVSGNTSTDDGGGIAATFGNVTLNSSTVSGNSGGGDGGGIYNFSGAVELSSSTITDNTAGRMGGGVSINSSNGNPPITLSNTILAGNNVAGAPNDLSLDSGRTLSVDFSLIGVADLGLIPTQQDAISNGAGNQAGMAASPLDPLLGPLADNGGPTQTHALLPGSPAINAGALVNIAPLGTASQSSEEPNFGGPFPAERALDGDFGNFTHTASTGDENPSFTLDFDTDQFFTQIVLHNRGDGLVPERLRDITVAVLDANGTAVFTSELLNPNNNLNGPATITVTLPTMVQGLTVQVSRTGAVLSLGEIEVFAADQRGFIRSALGAVDIGAFEAQESPSLVVTTTDDVIDEMDQLTSLREAIAFANALPSADSITFDQGVFNGTIDLTMQLPTITDAVTIDGDNRITLDAGGGANGLIGNGDGFRIFNIDDGDTNNDISVMLSGLTLTGGDIGGGNTGGGVRNREMLTITSSTISGNSASSFGGGIYNSGTATITSSTISGNSASNGGGISNFGGTATITSSTISGNSASDGGGISNFGTATITSSTISGNSASSLGGGISNNGTANVTSSIVASNTAFIGENVNGSLSPSSEFNLIDVNPLLGPLADNGGPTQTHALLLGSPAINAGDLAFNTDPPYGDPQTEAVPFDQRGLPRIALGRGDIGAVEAQTPPSADFDSSGSVNGFDFLLWQRGFGTANAQSADGNSDDDTDVDASDLAAFQVSLGATTVTTTLVDATIGNGQFAFDDNSEAAIIGGDALSQPLTLDVGRDRAFRELGNQPGLGLSVVGWGITRDTYDSNNPAFGVDGNFGFAPNAGTGLGETGQLFVNSGSIRAVSSPITRDFAAGEVINLSYVLGSDTNSATETAFADATLIFDEGLPTEFTHSFAQASGTGTTVGPATQQAEQYELPQNASTLRLELILEGGSNTPGVRGLIDDVKLSVSALQLPSKASAASASTLLSTGGSGQTLVAAVTAPQVASTSTNAALIDAAIALATTDELDEAAALVTDETSMLQAAASDSAFETSLLLPTDASVEEEFLLDEKSDTEPRETQWLDDELLETVFG